MTTSAVDQVVEVLNSEEMIFLGAGASCCVGLPTCTGFFNKFFDLPFPKVLEGGLPILNGSSPKFDMKTCLVLNCLRALKIDQDQEGYDVEDLLEILRSLRELPENVGMQSLALYQLFTTFQSSAWDFRQFQGQYRKFSSNDLASLVSNAIDWLTNNINRVWGRRPNLGENGWDKWRDIFKRAKEKIKILPVFTTNYDSVFESMNNDSEFSVVSSLIDGILPTEVKGRRHYFDLGNYARQLTELQKDTKNLIVPYFKVHGSLEWIETSEEKILVRLSEGPPDPYQGKRGIFPPYKTKPTEKLGEPFDSMYQVLEEYLKKVKRCIVIGFSFRDIRLRKIFLDSLKENPDLRLSIMVPHPEQGPIKQFVDEVNKANIMHLTTIPMEFGGKDKNYITRTYEALRI